jgi:hypothetical protein
MKTMKPVFNALLFFVLSFTFVIPAIQAVAVTLHLGSDECIFSSERENVYFTPIF